MPPEVVQRVVRRDFTKIRACYDTALQRNPKLAGKIVVRFIISQDGNVTSASSEPETTLADATAVSGVVDQFKKLSFPQPEGGIVTVVYPLTFALADE